MKQKHCLGFEMHPAVLAAEICVHGLATVALDSVTLASLQGKEHPLLQGKEHPLLQLSLGASTGWGAAEIRVL